jgi:cytochrome P450
MLTLPQNIPPGPVSQYDPRDDLLCWMKDQFGTFGDIYKASIYGLTAYVTRDLVHARHVLADNAHNYRKGLAIKRVAMLLGNGLMVSEGQFWRSQRRMIQPAFHRRTIGGLFESIVRSNLHLLQKWELAARRGDRINITRDINHTILDVILNAVFGPDSVRVANQFEVLSNEHARNLGFAQTFGTLRKLVQSIFDERRLRSTSSDDILNMLMSARALKTGLPMSDHQLFNEIRTLIVAGHETTASTLSWTWYLLSQHPEVERKLSAELSNLPGDEPLTLDSLSHLDYARRIVDEVLRLYPAGWLLTRRAMEDDHLGEYFVPKGTEIYVSPYFIHRHPDLWEDADTFNPDRFELEKSKDRQHAAMLPFSIGPRVCIGEALAQIEMQVHLVTVGKRLRFQLVDQRRPEVEAAVNLRSKHDFIMNLELKTNMN